MRFKQKWIGTYIEVRDSETITQCTVSYVLNKERTAVEVWFDCNCAENVEYTAMPGRCLCQ